MSINEEFEVSIIDESVVDPDDFAYNGDTDDWAWREGRL